LSDNAKVLNIEYKKGTVQGLVNIFKVVQNSHDNVVSLWGLREGVARDFISDVWRSFPGLRRYPRGWLIHAPSSTIIFDTWSRGF
ncbi:hypothetical protein PENTCL1PPCAC_21489, partial [Pristionchus entomophagus]